MTKGNLYSDLQSHGLSIGDLVLYVGSKCNLRCKHCYVGNDLLNKAQEYSFSDIVSLCTGIDDLERLSILGGEPLLHNEINNILGFFGDMSIQERRITTNLVEITDDQVEKLVSAGFRICVSLDGANAQTNDFVRGRGVYNKVIHNIQRLRRYTDNIEIIYTVNRVNINGFDNLLLLAKELGIRMINLHRMNLRGNALSHHHMEVTPTEWRSFVNQIESRASEQEPGCIRIRYELGFVTKNELHELTKSGKYHPHSDSSFYSKSGRGRVVVYSDNKIYVSSEAFGTTANIGSLDGTLFFYNDSPSNEIWLAKKEPFHWLERINPLLGGDFNYPIPLSVSYRLSSYLVV